MPITRSPAAVISPGAQEATEAPWVLQLRSVEVSVKGLALFLAAVPAAALAAHFLPSWDHPVLCAVKLFATALAIGLLPGLATVLLARPLRRLTVLEAVGFAIALSFVILQLVAFYTFGLRRPVSEVWIGMWVLSAAAAFCLWAKARSQETILFERGEILSAGVVLLLAGLLYLRGSPALGEHYMHVGIFRRLALVAHPSPYTIFYVPSQPYMHPVPGVHLFMALVIHGSGLDPLFVYDKMRAFYSFASFTFLYLAARALFGSTRLAVVTVLSAVALVLNGAFAEFPSGAYSGQLAVFSHPSDVDMSVLLPAMIVSFFYFLEASSPRALRFFFLQTIGLALVLTFVHLREIFQFLVYLASFAAALCVFRREKKYIRRTSLVMAVTMGLGLAYGLWVTHAVAYVGEGYSQIRSLALDVARGFTVADFFRKPLLAPSDFIKMFHSLFRAWSPLLILASPLVFFSFRKRPLMLFVAASVFGFLLIIRFPALSLPYIYVTYQEILYTPVRNILFFLYLCAGPFLYWVALQIAQLKGAVSRAGGVAVAALALAWFTRQQERLAQHPDLLFMPALLAYTVAFGAARAPSPGVPASARRAVARRWPVLLGWLVILAAALTPVRYATPLALAASPISLTPQALLRDLPCREVGASKAMGCPPSLELVEWAKRNVPPESMLLFNVLNPYTPAAFLPAKMVTWPREERWILQKHGLFPDYDVLARKADQRYGEQLFFNERESLDERLDAVRVLRVTHVLVDPMFYGRLVPLLGHWPGVFRPVYDDGRRWAVYEVQSQ